MSTDLSTAPTPVSTVSRATDDVAHLTATGPLSLRRNFSWTLLGNLVYAACQWGVIVVLAHLGTPEMVGQFVLALAVTAPVIALASLQLRGLQATDAKGEYLFGHYLALRLATTAAAVLVIGAVAFVVGGRLEITLAILVIGLAKAFESISDVFFGLFQRLERMDRIAVSMMIKGPLVLLLLGAGVYLTGSILGGAVGMMIAWAVMLWAYDIRRAAGLVRDGLVRDGDAVRLRPCWQSPAVGRLAWRALPLGIVMLLISLKTNIPRYFIESSLGTEQLGIFGSMACFMIAGAYVVGALGQAASPRLAQYHVAGNRRAFRRLLHKLLALACLLGAGGVAAAAVLGRPLLAWLFGAEYSAHASVFPWLMLAAGIGYVAMPLGFAATATRRIRFQPLVLGTVVLVTVVTSYLFIGPYGLQGAAISLIVASITCVVGYRLLLPLRDIAS
jgi:O-antigen/teichoic acid export membrane protein